MRRDWERAKLYSHDNDSAFFVPPASSALMALTSCCWS